MVARVSAKAADESQIRGQQARLTCKPMSSHAVLAGRGGGGLETCGASTSTWTGCFVPPLPHAACTTRRRDLTKIAFSRRGTQSMASRTTTHASAKYYTREKGQ